MTSPLERPANNLYAVAEEHDTNLTIFFERDGGVQVLSHCSDRFVAEMVAMLAIKYPLPTALGLAAAARHIATGDQE